MTIPENIQKLADELATLPSIGPRQAIRLAFYIAGEGEKKADSISRALSGLKTIGQCSRCHFYVFRADAAASASSLLCSICVDKTRDGSLLCILEKETDLISIENSRVYRGTYFVLGGPINDARAKGRVQKSRERLAELIARLTAGSLMEIIIATNPTTEGDLTAIVLKKELAPYAKKISRLGRGIPTGADIEFADEETLGAALENRK
jgi:recombination protein RecR